jgi:hypothetical protein
MLKAVVVVEEAKAVNALRKIAKTIIAKATQKEELAAAVASPALFTNQVQRSPHLSRPGIFL